MTAPDCKLLNLIGVLDIKSPSSARFSEIEETAVEKLFETFYTLQETRENFI